MKTVRTFDRYHSLDGPASRLHSGDEDAPHPNRSKRECPLIVGPTCQASRTPRSLSCGGMAEATLEG